MRFFERGICGILCINFSLKIFVFFKIDFLTHYMDFPIPRSDRMIRNHLAPTRPFQPRDWMIPWGFRVTWLDLVQSGSDNLILNRLRFETM